MKIYLAARYERRTEMQAIRDSLVGTGHNVTSRWIDQTVNRFHDHYLNTYPERCAMYASKDLDDLYKCDCLVMFSEDTQGRGGRHIEFGLALALHKQIIIVGRRENVFHCLPAVAVVSNLDEFYKTLRQAVELDEVLNHECYT